MERLLVAVMRASILSCRHPPESREDWIAQLRDGIVRGVGVLPSEAVLLYFHDGVLDYRQRSYAEEIETPFSDVVQER